MAITINWATKVINIPKADTTLVDIGPPEIRSLDLDVFRLTLKDIEDSEEGMPFLDTHQHNPPVTVGGVTLARVVEIINGYTVEFEDGQYAVNLVGANSNVSDVTVVNQVSIRSANSAGLTYSKQVEDSAFTDARVWINTNTGTSGTIYPRGTISDPVDNLVDAQTIIAIRNLPKRLHLTGSLTITGTDDLSDYDILGGSPELSNLTFNIGAVTTNLIVENISVTGDLNGDVTFKHVTTNGGLIDFDGVLFESGLSGTVDLGAGGAETHDFIDCYSHVPGNSAPIIDCNDLNNLDVQFRRYSGGLTLQNYSGALNNMSIDLTAGSVLLDNTCTEGTIVIRGVGDLTDNSGTNCTVITNGLVKGALAERLLRNKYVVDQATGKLTLYNDDGTHLIEGDVFEDAAGIIPYRGRGIERRERLE